MTRTKGDVKTEVFTENFVLYSEFQPFGLILHCYVRNGGWNKTTLLQIKGAVASVVRSSALPVYAFHYTPDAKFRKFVRAVGGVPDHTRNAGDGEPVEMFWFPPLD